MADLLEKAKLTLRVMTDDFDDEINDLISAGEADLATAGVTFEEIDDLVWRAISTYVRMNFGNPDNYERLKKSYDEQKAQLSMRSGYTTWIEV